MDLDKGCEYSGGLAKIPILAQRVLFLFIPALVMQHLQHTLNKEGKIAREDYYFNPAQFPE